MPKDNSPGAIRARLAKSGKLENLVRSVHMPSLQQIDDELARRSLYEFTRQAWRIVYGNEMVDNWHFRAMARIIQEAMTQPASRTILNVFPRSGKSTLLGVMLTPWMWVTDPTWCSLNIAGSLTLGARDSRQARNLICSQWYQRLTRGTVTLASDQNEKVNFANTAGGTRLTVPIGAAITGLDGHAIILDDPNNASDINDATLDGVNETYDLSLCNRLKDPATGQIFVLQQRVHCKDLTGHLLDAEPGIWNHIVIRSEYEIGDPYAVPEDPRSEAGELAFPQRIPQAFIDSERRLKGPIFMSGQHQQRPVPLSGGMFDVDLIEIVDALPPTLDRQETRCRAWDFAYTEARGDYTASCKGVMDWGRDDPMLYIIDITNEHVRNPLTEVRRMLILDDRDVHIRVPRDPGGGNRTADEAISLCVGRVAGDFRPQEKKEVTWLPLSSWINAGRVKLLRGPWNKPFIDQLRIAPRGAHDDMIDAATECYSYLSQRGPGEMEIMFFGR